MLGSIWPLFSYWLFAAAEALALDDDVFFEELFDVETEDDEERLLDEFFTLL